MPYDVAAMMIMFTAFIVAIFYCLDALHGERRDRSILFWKSLPVSDRTTVLSKAFVPLVILPSLTFVVIQATQLIMLLISTLALAPSGLAGTTWTNLPVLRLSVILFYYLITDALWQAPIYGWLLLVGGYARRATFLWAVLPWLAVCAIEKIVIGTSYFAQMLNRRITGSYQHAFVVVQYPKDAHVPIVDRLTQLDPLKFLSSPGLWIGFVIAAAFIIGAIQLRRYRGPL
jgi:ABC-2 type transport system permease protein